ncbi:MAG TPA: hypothetical protein VME69_12505 [Methylocella sp.]|nr:hypothetical protein [Methylocella sp.]
MNIQLQKIDEEPKGTVVAFHDPRVCQEKLEEKKPTEVLVHVRFFPNADVRSIDYCPKHLSKNDWFFHLCYSAPHSYQTFMGGRGLFRIERSEFESIVNDATPAAAAE